jgi:hypothetical protein
MIEDAVADPAAVLEIAFPKATRRLRGQVIRDVLWYRGCKDEPVLVVLVRDPAGPWRDEALVATDPTAAAAFVILGYCRRWSVETYLKDLKQTMGRDVLRCQSVAGVTKELTVYCLVSTRVRATMLEAASRQGVAAERVSFGAALRWLAAAWAGEPVPEPVVNPHRPGRFEPRSTQRRLETDPWLTAPRHE